MPSTGWLRQGRLKRSYGTYRATRVGTPRLAVSPDGPWQETAKRFVNPTTGQLMKVMYNPQTGARDYVPVSPDDLDVTRP